jgi:hypothetical protein
MRQTGSIVFVSVALCVASLIAGCAARELACEFRGCKGLDRYRHPAGKLHGIVSDFTCGYLQGTNQVPLKTSAAGNVD